MLNLRRRPGQSIRITHHSGEVLIIRIQLTAPSEVRLAFEDEARNFEIVRPEAEAKAASPAP